MLVGQNSWGRVGRYIGGSNSWVSREVGQPSGVGMLVGQNSWSR